MRILTLSLLVCIIGAGTALAQNSHPPQTVTVQASDTLLVTPDRAVIRFAVVTRAQDPEVARQENEETSASTLNAVRGLNIPDRQIQVQSLRISEEVEYRNGRRVRIGFIARRDVSVILDDLDRLPAVVARVTQEGTNEFGGISYQIQDTRSLENEALRRAALRAREKADILVTTLGTSILGVQSINESGVSIPYPPVPQYARATMAMDSYSEGTPEAYSEGQIEVRATVTVSFLIQ